MSKTYSKDMSGLIKILVLCIVGLALTPTIQAQVTTILANTATGDLNMTGPGRAMIGLFSLFWVILMIAIPTAYIGVWLKD